MKIDSRKCVPPFSFQLWLVLLPGLHWRTLKSSTLMDTTWVFRTTYPLRIPAERYQAGATPVPKAPAVGAVSQPVTYNPTAAIASASVAAATATAPILTPTGTSETRRDVYHFDTRGVNDPCGKQPPGSGTVPSPDTVEAFMTYAPYAVGNFPSFRLACNIANQAPGHRQQCPHAARLRPYRRVPEPGRLPLPKRLYGPLHPQKLRHDQVPRIL